MKVLCDLHHTDLYYSLQLLFEKRMGFEMYRPIGLEWQQEGFWHVFDHPATALQFLGTDQATNRPVGINGPFPDHELLNKNYRIEDGIYYVTSPTEGKLQRAVTLPKFKEMDFDILISSIPAHIQPFNQLISQFQPKAKHIFQVGNIWGRQSGVQNILASTAPFNTPPTVNTVFYHQEFDLDVYKYIPPITSTVVNSYIHYMSELDLLGQYNSLLNSLDFTTYGAGMDDVLHGSQYVADAMASAGWTWHVKPGGDGYGHILHNSYACGRPAIIKENHYAGQIGSLLLEDGVTCVDISKRSVYENVALLRQLSRPEAHQAMCERVYKRFKQVVDFDTEEVKLKKFLEDLK